MAGQELLMLGWQSIVILAADVVGCEMLVAIRVE